MNLEITNNHSMAYSWVNYIKTTFYLDCSKTQLIAEEIFNTIASGNITMTTLFLPLKGNVYWQAIAQF